MLVLNTSPRLITIGASYVPPKLPPEIVEQMPDVAKARLAARLALCHGEIVLGPGANEVNGSDWSKITHETTGNALVKWYLDEGILVAKKGVDSIRDVKDIAEAVKIINATGDLVMLARWREGETRKRIVDALDKQTAAVTELLAQASAETGATVAK